MNWRNPKLWISAFSIAAVSVFAVVDVRRTSPGPISAVHGAVSDLESGQTCSACHGGWFSDMTDSCLECHAPIAEQLDAKRGLHGRLEPTLAATCGTCHGEHHGADFALVNDATFRKAGATSRAGFDHALVGWQMDGAHLGLSCVECHEHADDVVLAEGTRRFLGNAQDCVSCHEDVHEGRMRVACAACHGQETWDQLHSEGHDAFLPLVGGHGDVDCRQCHAETDPHSLENMTNDAVCPTPRDCVSCHASPHSTGFVAGMAQLVDMPERRSCVRCHVAEHTSFRAPDLTLTPEQHARTGFALATPHDAARCEQCHDPAGPSFRARHPGRSPDACSACHADPHGGQFAQGLFAAQECTACHAREHFVPPSFDVAKHATTAMPLTGRHEAVECNACHLRDTPQTPREFHGTPSSCDECHADAHAGFFAGKLDEITTPAQGECAACHVTDGFATIPPPGFDHARFTAFALAGAHVQEDCTGCHVPTAAADETGRRFGRIARHEGEFQGCVTCHVDVHRGAFDAPHLPALVDGRADCARCHDETSFRSLPHGFEHGRWTGFQLEGAHGEASCSACHEPVASPARGGRTWSKALGAACSDCHVDPHVGQFETDGRTDCARCHTDALPDFLAFNHDRDSRFPLEEQHDDLACAACHQPFTTTEGFESTRYKPLGTECVDCHGSQADDVLTKRKRRRGG